MKVTIQRDALLKPLQMIAGVVEKRQTLPILSNVLLSVMAETKEISFIGTDTEIELIGKAQIESASQSGSFTVSARKLLDICRALPEDAMVELAIEGEQVVLRSAKSRFLLTTLPASDFPSIESGAFATEVKMSQAKLKKLLSKVHFAMGQQDVRHYLNGALFDINQGVIKCVATDGHRLALTSMAEMPHHGEAAKVIIPRKSILELIRLLDVSDEMTTVSIGENHFRVTSAQFTFTSKLISAQYPDYEKLIPRSIEHTAIASREGLKQALTRASILSNEKFRGIRLHLDRDILKIVANNPEQEEAEEQIHFEYQGNAVEIGFNVSYLLDVLSTIASDTIRWSFKDPSGGVLMESADKDDSLYVVMPMRL